MTDLDLDRAVRLLGLTPADLRSLRTPEGLAGLKTRAKRAWKAAALRLHPDRTGGDEARTEDFKLVTGFLEELGRLEVPATPLRKRRRSYNIRVTVRVPCPADLG